MTSEETLEKRMLKLREKSDYRLDKEKPVIAMIDGRGFSKIIKNKFKLPFDEVFIEYMNQTAEYVCREIQGCKGAFVQSDEISFFIDSRTRPTDKNPRDPYFGFRLCKMNSIIASTAAVRFYKLSGLEVQFDCKSWNVKNNNDVYAWFLFRQLDCIRNSKQQAAQTYLTYEELRGKTSDEQIELLLKKNGVDWNSYSDGEKYGRFVWKDYEIKTNPDLDITYRRSIWKANPGWELSKDKEKFLEIYCND